MKRPQKKRKMKLLVEERKRNASAGRFRALEIICTRCLHKNAKEKKPSRRRAQAMYFYFIIFKIIRDRKCGHFHFASKSSCLVGPKLVTAEQTMIHEMLRDPSIKPTMTDG